MSVLSRPPCAAGGILVNSMDGPALLFCEWHPCAAKPKTPIRMSAHASFFGATLATHPALPCRGWFLASMSDPKLSALMIPSLGTLNKPQGRLLWGNLKAYFHDLIKRYVSLYQHSTDWPCSRYSNSLQNWTAQRKGGNGEAKSKI